MFTPRRHSRGGYELLLPCWADGLWFVDVNINRVMREKSAWTVWAFKVVDR
jgi:hypothetical protein